MKLQALREKAWETEDCTPSVSPAVQSEIDASKGLPGDWTIGFDDKNPGTGTKSRGYFIKTFHIPTQEYGTAFKLRIKQVENLLGHHCHEIKALPDNVLKITLTTHDAESFTAKDAELARLINRAYDPHGTNKGKDFSKEHPEQASAPPTAASVMA